MMMFVFALLLVGVLYSASPTEAYSDYCETPEGGGSCQIPVEFYPDTKHIDPDGKWCPRVTVKNSLLEDYDKSVELELENVLLKESNVKKRVHIWNTEDDPRYQNLSYKTYRHNMLFKLPSDVDVSEYDAVMLEVHNPVDVKRLNFESRASDNRHLKEFGMLSDPAILSSFRNKVSIYREKKGFDEVGKNSFKEGDSDYVGASALEHGHGYEGLGSRIFSYDNPKFYVTDRFADTWESEDDEDPEIEFQNQDDVRVIAHFKKFEEFESDDRIVASLRDSSTEIIGKDGETSFTDPKNCFSHSAILDECSEEFEEDDTCFTELDFETERSSRISMDFYYTSRARYDHIDASLSGAVVGEGSETGVSTSAMIATLAVVVVATGLVLYYRRK